MSTRSPHRIRRPLATLAAIGCALAVGACGGSAVATTKTTTKPPPRHAPNESAALRFSACMRTHGVPKFPNPTTTGIALTSKSGINPNAASFKRAETACAKLVPGITS
jgi:hypothetical protein